MKRIIVTGSRDLRDYQIVERWLDAAQSFLGVGPKYTVVVHGACRGADALAAEWANAREAWLEPHPADWHLGGKGAGPARNTRMVNGGGDLGVAFWTGSTSGSGTFACLTKISRAGIPLWVVHV